MQNQLNNLANTVVVPSPWLQTHTYFKSQLVTYKNKLYQAASDYGTNYSKPDDLLSWFIYEMFNYPSRSFVVVHVAYGLCVLIYTFFALNQRTQLYIFLG